MHKSSAESFLDCGIDVSAAQLVVAYQGEGGRWGGLAHLWPEPITEMAAPPFAVFERWVPPHSGAHSQFSPPLLINQHRPGVAVSIVPVTAPPPLSGLQHQPPLHRILMHVI